MKKKTYEFVKHVPFGNLVLVLTGNNEFMTCSPMIEEMNLKPILEFKKEHPDIVITEKLAKKILKGE